MIFEQVEPYGIHQEVYALLSDCKAYRLVIYMVNSRAMRIRIYTSDSRFHMSPIDWCVGMNRELAERLLGLIITYLKDRDDLGELDWGKGYQYSDRKPIHNDQAFLNKLLSLVDEPFEPHQLPPHAR